jgi:RsiW-degrading membrane proteinase PrsW (M82 family)
MGISGYWTLISAAFSSHFIIQLIREMSKLLPIVHFFIAFNHFNHFYDTYIKRYHKKQDVQKIVLVHRYHLIIPCDCDK